MQSASCPRGASCTLAALSDRASPPLIPTINALTLQDFKHDCPTIGMFSNTTIPSTIRSEKLSKSRWCPIHVSTPPSKSMYVLSICKTWVQIYLFRPATVIFKHHLVSGEGWVMALERGRPWRCKNINWLTFAFRRQFDHSLFCRKFEHTCFFCRQFVIDRFQVGAFFDQLAKKSEEV